MKQHSLFPQILTITAAMIFLGALGAYWPSLISAENRAPDAAVDGAVSYQGYLTNPSNNALNGTYPMRFILYNAAAGGTLLWDSGTFNVGVTDGLFETRLAIDPSNFNGEELWMAQYVSGELLTPRQEILPAPYAHSLRPGAIIKATGSDTFNNYTVEVHMNNDGFAFNRGAITGQSTTGNAIYGLANNGRAIYGQTQNGYAVYGFDGGSNPNEGYGGYFYSTNGIGAYGYSGADRTHDNILAPGVYGQSNRGVGVYGRGDTSDSYSFFNEGGYFEGGKGLYARGTDPSNQAGYGARIYSTNYRGMYVTGKSGQYDAYFGLGAGISASNVIDRGGRTQSLVVNLGTATIAPGDLVAIVGVAENPENGEALLGLAKVDAENRNGVVGVAGEAISAETITDHDGSSYVDFNPTSGTIAPNGYFIVITNGLAPAVNVSSLARGTSFQIGDKIAISADGTLGRSSDDGIVIGKVAGEIDVENGTIPVFVDVD